MSKIERNFPETELRTGAWVLWSWASALPENPVREGVKQETQGADAVSEKAHRYLRPRGREGCGPQPSTELVLPRPPPRWARCVRLPSQSLVAASPHQLPERGSSSISPQLSLWAFSSQNAEQLGELKLEADALLPTPNSPQVKQLKIHSLLTKKLQDKTSRAVREEARPCQNHIVLIPEVRRSLLTTRLQKRLLRGQREAMSKECST